MNMQPELFKSNLGITSSAMFSPCRLYRYALWRDWNANPACVFIGLNPSTADETNDDPTIRRCIEFARSWGYGSICMLNLFAFRSTDPKAMLKASEPVGPDNDEVIREACSGAAVVVAAWGKRGQHMGRDRKVLAMVRDLKCLKVNQDGTPQHPLYLPATLTPIHYT